MEPQSLKAWEEEARIGVDRVAKKLIPRLPSDGVFLDIGANVGLVTRQVLATHTGLTCVLFEPITRYADICRQRFADNPRVTVHNLGLSDKKESATILLHPRSLGQNTLLKSRAQRDAIPEKIKLVTLDSFNFPRIDAMKIDVEAWEASVLRGARQTILQHKPVMVIEVEASERSDDTAAEIAWLESIGYTWAREDAGDRDPIFLPPLSLLP